MIKRFFFELNLQELISLALVITIKTILGRFSFGPTYVKVGLGFIGSVALGYFFGPVWGAVGGGISDLVNSALFGSEDSFFIGFTLTTMFTPMIYGAFFYKKTIKIWRIVATSLLVTILVDILLNAIWLHFIYKVSFTVALTARLLKGIIVPWIQVIIIFFVLNSLQRVNERRKKLEKSRM